MADEQDHWEVRTVRQVGVWSFTKIAGLMGLLWSIMLAVPAIALGGVVPGVGSVGQIAVLVVAAGLYGGFAGAVSAVIYNLAAEFAGGIAVRIE